MFFNVFVGFFSLYFLYYSSVRTHSANDANLITDANPRYTNAMGIACDRFYGHFTLITTEERAICVAINFCYLICNQFSFALLQQQQDTHAAANIAIRETQGERGRAGEDEKYSRNRDLFTSTVSNSSLAFGFFIFLLAPLDSAAVALQLAGQREFDSIYLS